MSQHTLPELTETEKAHLEKYPHYFKDVRHLNIIDVYAIMRLFGITNQEQGHAFKKILAAGNRGAKSMIKDMREVIDTLERSLELEENCDIIGNVPPRAVEATSGTFDAQFTMKLKVYSHKGSRLMVGLQSEGSSIEWGTRDGGIVCYKAYIAEVEGAYHGVVAINSPVQQTTPVGMVWVRDMHTGKELTIHHTHLQYYTGP